MKRKIAIGAVLVVLVLLGAFWYGRGHLLHSKKDELPVQYTAKEVKPMLNSSVPKFDHVVIIVEENKEIGSIIGNPKAPFLNKLADQYTLATNYYAATHPSLPNYLELTSGTNGGITNDCNPPGAGCQAEVPNIADRIEESGHTWKAYAEGMPEPCTTRNVGRYATKHMPFLYYPDIRNNEKRCRTHVVPFDQLQTDLLSAQLPDYVFITPDLCSDMHDCSIETGDTWLASEVTPILSSAAFTQEKSLLVITWDEGTSDSNRIPTIFAGPLVREHYQTSAYYSHYSLLHTIEESWGLKPLTGNDGKAPVISDIYK